MTDPAIIKEFGIHDANPFFSTLLTKPYLDSVVISPHLYGPSVSNRKDFYKGKDWMESLDKAFGYLGQKPGYCANGKCHVFPIAVGEFGSRFTNPEDLAHLSDLALYMNAQGAGNTGGHKAFNNWFYCESRGRQAAANMSDGRGGEGVGASLQASSMWRCSPWRKVLLADKTQLQSKGTNTALACCNRSQEVMPCRVVLTTVLACLPADACCIQGATTPTAVTLAVWLTTPGK